ncbi:MAG: hypothetical protein H0W76_24565 [Pyrinomonadaceae bacterium]|nr:hypothetical protein [Pyrinomonadaceae bacterium]
MKPITQEWIGKAEGDYDVTHREVRARKSPSYDAACFRRTIRQSFGLSV